jgi:transcriptional regulator with XRE-family HTH domain
MTAKPLKPQPVPGRLAVRLTHLFDTVHPGNRGPYSPGEVAAAIAVDGGEISRAYIAYLRSGERDNPTVQQMQALANFFGVPVAYFFDDTVARQVDAELEVVVALRDAGVQQLALRASGLSERGLQAILGMVESVRLMEGLSPGPGHDV